MLLYYNNNKAAIIQTFFLVLINVKIYSKETKKLSVYIIDNHIEALICWVANNWDKPWCFYMGKLIQPK